MEQQITNSDTPAMSPDIRALASAFLQAKQEFNVTGKSGKNTQFGKYAKIEDIYHAVEGALGKYGIIIWHFARPDHRTDCKDQELLYTRLIHVATGQFIEDCRMLESEKPGNQSRGAANTYMKRYALLSLCAIPTEDDDCEAEQRYIEQPTISGEQLVTLNKELKACKNAQKLYNDILGFNNIKDLYQLKKSQFKGAMDHVLSKKEPLDEQNG